MCGAGIATDVSVNASAVLLNDFAAVQPLLEAPRTICTIQHCVLRSKPSRWAKVPSAVSDIDDLAILCVVKNVLQNTP
eukprot:11374341-Prorocentrum_lima.AAC.1